jgi:hypothetical protein
MQRDEIGVAVHHDGIMPDGGCGDEDIRGAGADRPVSI